MRRNTLSILIDLAMVACPYMLDAVTFHGKPIVAGSYDLSGQLGSTSMSSKQSFMHLFHQMVSLGGIYALKQSCIMVPLIQDFPTQEELACHASDEFLLTIHGSGQVFTIHGTMASHRLQHRRSCILRYLCSRPTRR